MFFFNDTATTEIYTLSLHDALPISNGIASTSASIIAATLGIRELADIDEEATARIRKGHLLLAMFNALQDRKSTRLNSSHANISYAVFCLKKIKFKDKATGRLSHLI